MTNSDLIETKEYKGYKIHIYPDEIAGEVDTPNDWGGPFLVYDHKQFCVGTKEFDVKQIAEYLNLKAKYSEVDYDLQEEFDRLNEKNYDIEQDYLTENEEDRLEDLGSLFGWKEEYENYWIFPVHAYIHSGVALSLSRSQHPFTDMWDVSSSGFILVPKDEYVDSEKKARINAKNTIETWNQLLSGQVYGYEIVDPEGKEIDSLWGLYGEKQLMEHAEDTIEADIKEKTDEYCKNVAQY